LQLYELLIYIVTKMKENTTALEPFSSTKQLVKR